MVKLNFLNNEEFKLLSQTKRKLGERIGILLDELIETIEVLSDQKMMKNVHNGLEDIKAGRVKDLRELL